MCELDCFKGRSFRVFDSKFAIVYICEISKQKNAKFFFFSSKFKNFFFDSRKFFHPKLARKAAKRESLYPKFRVARDFSSSRALLKVGFHLEAQNLSLKNAALRVEKRAVTSST